MVNRARKGKVKTAVKHFQAAAAEGNLEAAQSQLRLAGKRIDQVAATGTIHKRTAARRKSRLARSLNNLKAGKA